MDQIIGIDPANRLADVQAAWSPARSTGPPRHTGYVCAGPRQLQESTIGGNIATNAGGLRCVKYG